MAETERHRSTLQASVATKKQKLNQSKEKEEKVNRKIEQLRNEIEAITIQLDEHWYVSEVVVVKRLNKNIGEFMNE